MYSFSQNFEDVYIYRAFREVKNGFYIDAGAFDPVVDSVTKMLYDLGWFGINLEPGPSFPTFACRTRDINLPYALSSADGEIDFHYNASDPATSTTASTNIPDEPVRVQSYKVTATTLEALVRAHAPNQHIHFLKLDIEGAEWDILRTTDWRSVRPELIIVESSLPYTNERRDAGWADHMKTFGYKEVFFDGVNTYFLREESLDRKGAFAFPVNVLDRIRKFDPYQRYSVNDVDSSGLIRSISQEVSRVVDDGESAVREFLESDLGPGLRVQKELIEQLRSEQSEHYSRLQRIVSDVSEVAPDTLARPTPGRGGNSIEAVIEELAEGVARVVEQLNRQANELVLAKDAAEGAKAAFHEQASLADEAKAEVRLIAKRLADARASRTTMLELTERVAGALDRRGGAPEIARTAVEHDRQTIPDAEVNNGAERFTRRITTAWKIPIWRRMMRFRTRSLVRRADSCRDSGRFDEAAEAYAKGYALRPDRPDLCLQMANMWTQLRSFDLAEDAYREVLEKAPGDGLAHFHFGHMLEMSNRPAEAHRAYTNAAALMPDHVQVIESLNRTKASQYRDDKD